MQSTATKQRIKESDIKQATLQAISVIQTTIQCGIAQVCFSRNLFPASFFRQVEINATDNGSQNVDRIVVFDLDSDSAGSAMTSLQTTSQLEEERKRGSGSKSESESGINHQSQEAETNLSLFSPLTCSFDETMSVHTHHMNSQLQGSREQRRNSDKSLCSGNDYLKAEIRLLLHWVQGLLDILHDNDGRNSLMRVIFGICKPGASNDGGIVGDKVLESFAFDISSMMQQVGGAFEHQSLKRQYQTLFRNLQSFTSIPLDVHSGAIGLDSPDRYFTLRVEFREECHLPHALDPTNIINRDYVPCMGEGSRSIVCESMERMVETVLGQIVEKNCTGLGIKVSAYNDIGDDKIDEGGESSVKLLGTRPAQDVCNEVRCAKRLKMDMERTEDFNSSDSNSHCNARSHNASSPAVESVFENGARAYAVPLPPPLTQNYAKYKRSAQYLPCTILDSRLKKSKLLQYKIYFDEKDLEKPKQWIASRNVITEDSLKCQIGEELKHLMSRYRDSDEMPTYKDVLESIGESLTVSAQLVRNVINPVDVQRICHDTYGDNSCGTANSDDINEENCLHYESGVGAMTLDVLVPVQFHYSFAMNPFTIVK